MTNHSRLSTVDWEADIYAKGQQLNLWPFSSLVSAVLRETSGSDRTMLRILEVGCGAGNNVYFLAKSGFNAFGIDQSASAIEFTGRRLSADGLNADLRVGDLCNLPYPSETFDYVLDRGALTHNCHESVRRILEEIHRVLGTGGKLFSFDLFGTNHSQMQLGTEISHHCRDHFTGGYFARVGLTSFFDAEDLDNLFVNFSNVVFTRKVEFDRTDRILAESYDLSASKP